MDCCYSNLLDLLRVKTQSVYRERERERRERECPGTRVPILTVKIIAVRELVQHDDYLQPRETESLLVKLNFTLSECPKDVGSVVSQPLINSVTGVRDSGHNSAPSVKGNNSDGQPLVDILLFFKNLFANVPHLEFFFGRMRGTSSLYDPTLVRGSCETDWV